MRRVNARAQSSPPVAVRNSQGESWIEVMLLILFWWMRFRERCSRGFGSVSVVEAVLEDWMS